jgi:hypothetical protein
MVDVELDRRRLASSGARRARWRQFDQQGLSDAAAFLDIREMVAVDDRQGIDARPIAA